MKEIKKGSLVKVKSFFGRPIGGKQAFVMDIKKGNSQSGILIKIDIYPNYLDRAWLIVME